MVGQRAHTEAWVTLATTDSYALGALVLGSSLRRAGTTRKKVVMVTAETMSREIISALEKVFDEVVDVSVIDSKDAANLALLERPDLGITFTKLHCWRLTRFSKCIFLDADTLVLKNCDELFDKDEFSAAPDAGWPDCFNSGVFVYKPSEDTYDALIQHISNTGSFDGGDQGLLNTFFSDWATKDIAKHLSFLYNMCATATYTYLPAYRFYGHNVRIIHFIGASKPWHVQFDSDGQPLPRYGEEHTLHHLKQWWQIFRSDVQPTFGENLEGLVHSSCALPPSSAMCESGALSSSRHQGGAAAASSSTGDRRERWEEGRPDYMGSASFDNILKKIDETMNTPECSPTGSYLDLSSSLPSNLDHVGLDSGLQDQCQQTERLERSVSFHELPTFCFAVVDEQHNPPAADLATSNRSDWERGRPDYRGLNAFDNILARLDETMAAGAGDEGCGKGWEMGGGGGGGWEYQQWHQQTHGQHTVAPQQEPEPEHLLEQHHTVESEHHEHQEAPNISQEHHHPHEEDLGEPDECVPVATQEHQNSHENDDCGEACVEEQDKGESESSSLVVAAVPEAPVDALPPVPDDAREEWERNQPDYRGKASFDFILRRIEATTGKIRRADEVTPSTIVAPVAATGEVDGEAIRKRPSNVRDSATQTPSLATPYDTGLRQLSPLPLCPQCGQRVSLEERENRRRRTRIPMRLREGGATEDSNSSSSSNGEGGEERSSNSTRNNAFFDLTNRVL